MDFKEIKALGEKTNRIIEIQGIISDLEEFAVHSLKSDTASVNIDLRHSCNPDSDSTDDPASNIGFLYLKNFLPPGTRIVPRSKHDFKKPDISIKLTGNYQYHLFEALISVLKEEQKGLKNLIKKDTGTI